MAIGVGRLEEHAAAKPLLDTHGKAVVTGPSAVVSEQDPTELRIRDALGNRNLTRRIKRWRILVPPLGKLLADVADIPHVEEQVVRERMLDIEVPLLDIGSAIALVDAEGDRGSAP